MNIDSETGEDEEVGRDAAQLVFTNNYWIFQNSYDILVIMQLCFSKYALNKFSIMLILWLKIYNQSHKFWKFL